MQVIISFTGEAPEILASNSKRPPQWQHFHQRKKVWASRTKPIHL